MTFGEVEEKGEGPSGLLTVRKTFSGTDVNHCRGDRNRIWYGRGETPNGNEPTRLGGDAAEDQRYMNW